MQDSLVLQLVSHILIQYVYLCPLQSISYLAPQLLNIVTSLSVCVYLQKRLAEFTVALTTK